MSKLLVICLTAMALGALRECGRLQRQELHEDFLLKRMVYTAQLERNARTHETKPALRFTWPEEGKL